MIKNKHENNHPSETGTHKIQNMKDIKNAIILNGTTYKVVRTNNIAGLGPDPCTLCDPAVKRRCGPDGYPDHQPCRMFNHGHYLAHFKKVK